MISSNLSTQKSLIFIVVQFLMILAILLLLTFTQSEIMTGVRAYVRAEGLYAKGHMQAIQHLNHFIQKQDNKALELFKESIAIPVGDRIARLALQRENPDHETAFQGFLQAGNDPKDIPSMIRLFIYFQDINYFREAISIWEQADILIEQLENTGLQIIRNIQTGQTAENQALISKIEMLDSQLVDHEINFSKALTEGSHWTRELLLILIISTLLILGVISTMLTKRLIFNINQTEEELASHKTRLEQIVYERTHQLENVLEGTNAGTWTWNLVNNKVDVNEKWLSMIGYSHADIPDVDFTFWEKNLHEKDKPHVNEKLQSHLQGQSDYYDVEFRLLHKKGWWVWINERGKITERDAANNPLVMSGTHIDITERKLIETERESARLEAEKSNKEKSRFLANMSHELRTPMHAIHSFTRLALKRDLDPKVKHFLENIEISTKRLTTLLNNLLDLSKLEAGKMDLNLQRTKVADLLEGTFSALDALIKEHNLNVSLSAEKEISIMIDAALMTQVFTNLISNAIKFSPKGGTITVTSKTAGEYLQISFEDEGIGIPDNERDSIFNSFVQSTKTITKSGGTGLGLPISREIVELHHGSIWVESPPAGKTQGSCFTVQLPLDSSVSR